MHRYNKSKCDKEGYRWFRYQESKSATYLGLLVLALAICPFFYNGLLSLLHLIIALPIAIVYFKFLFTRLYIASEDDGIYLIINSDADKIASWNDEKISFYTKKMESSIFNISKNIMIVSRGKDKREIYNPLCSNMDNFFVRAYEELNQVHERNKKRPEKVTS
jgi:hypothetical protein